jgi:DNA-binding NarL/FixJ family response regulator
VKEIKILIAEDSKLISGILRRTLSKIEGFNVVGVAEDGVAALELMREYKPDVLILDISMPLKDGIDVLAELRAEGSPIIVIMFTADQSPFVRKVCMNFGANYFLDKADIKGVVEICRVHLLAL